MITVEQCRSARALLGWSAQALADASAIGVATVWRFESGSTIAGASVEAISQAFEQHGVVFISPGEASVSGGAGVRLA